MVQAHQPPTLALAQLCPDACCKCGMERAACYQPLDPTSCSLSGSTPIVRALKCFDVLPMSSAAEFHRDLLVSGPPSPAFYWQSMPGFPPVLGMAQLCPARSACQKDLGHTMFCRLSPSTTRRRKLTSHPNAPLSPYPAGQLPCTSSWRDTSSSQQGDPSSLGSPQHNVIRERVQEAISLLTGMGPHLFARLFIYFFLV